MRTDDASLLRAHGIAPSAQRVAVARYALHTCDHPSADEVWQRVRQHFPQISRATVYNTLKLFVDKGLLRQYPLTEGHVVFDANVAPHHHFIDDATGAIHDVPWEAIAVSDVADLAGRGLDVREYQVVLRGNKNK